MKQTMTKIRIGHDGDLHIPAAVVREAGFKPQEEATLVFSHRRMIVGEPEQFTDPGELLEYLDAQGKIELCRFDQILADKDIPEVTLEQLDQILKGITIPVEEYLQKERAKVDDPFRS